MGKNPSLVFIYNSFRDPLFQNLVLSYINTLQQHNSTYTFYLITFEQKQYEIDKETQDNIRKDLGAIGIYWYPLKHHTGRFILAKKLYDLLLSIAMVSFIRFRYNTRLMFAFANVSASFGIILSKLLRIKLLIYSYEPHAAFQAELNLWSRNGIKYKLLSKIEQYAGTEAEYVITGTKYMVSHLKEIGAKGKVYRGPTSVDEKKFSFSKTIRYQTREELKVGDQPVLLYLGKFGGLYYRKETVLLYAHLQSFIPDLFFLVVTPNNNEEVESWFQQVGIRPTNYLVTGPFSDVVPYLCASDIGLNAIPPSPSQKYRSPTKIAEYLLCGLPYITCTGISEDDIVAKKHGVGAVLDDFSYTSLAKEVDTIKSLLKEGEALRGRCRHVGEMYRGKKNIDKLLSHIYSEVFQ